MMRAPGSKRFECDSTPSAHMLEESHPGMRSIIPEDPAGAFLCHLIEDFADEWCTKIMYYFRWADAEVAKPCASWVMIRSRLSNTRQSASAKSRRAGGLWRNPIGANFHHFSTRLVACPICLVRARHLSRHRFQSLRFLQTHSNSTSCRTILLDALR